MQTYPMKKRYSKAVAVAVAMVLAAVDPVHQQQQQHLLRPLSYRDPPLHLLRPLTHRDPPLHSPPSAAPPAATAATAQQFL